MFDVPVDAWYAWIGVAVASLAIFGVALSFPTTPAPDAASVADTVDRVAVTDHVASAEHPTDATAVRLEPRRISLRNDAGTTHARFAFGPITPVREGSRLHAVLTGAPPSAVFDSERAFHQALVRARSLDPLWTDADEPIRARHVSFGDSDATLVGA